MTLLVDAKWLHRRRRVAEGQLAALADSLSADLDRLLPAGDPFIPAEKARLTRDGGRCPGDGALLEFDPRAPRRHRCPQCGAMYDDEAHYRWWVMGYQLWLAERAVHAAGLWAVRGDERHRALAEAILRVSADRYGQYPNADNVLGPSRPFFSTYLESLWLLQLAVALDILEEAGAAAALGGEVRDRLVAPSAQLILGFDEGDSNRQVWNNAAIVAAARLLDRPEWIDTALHGPSGLLAHLQRGLLEDGTWYEGENYHLFAHRGLWYGVTLAEQAGAALPADARRRFQEGFATPFLSALPDFTFPARRDSPYGVSLRQWRIAEMCELGLARAPDERLSRGLGQLYRDEGAAGDTARWRSTGDAERNVAGVRLSRADLGWKSLLMALPDPPVRGDVAADSLLLEGQGLAILRRDAGAVYVALDYGTSGGGHGHPDRLNLWLVNGAHRVLEDVGTGSYVDPTLHWFRSTLAHNAPLVDGHSQARVDGHLLAWDEQGDCGWVSAVATPATDVVVRRAVMARATYLVDIVEWESPRAVTLDLPIHVAADVQPEPAGADTTLAGGDGEEDGFSHVERALRLPHGGVLSLPANGAHGWILPPESAEWWRCLAPGPPGSPARWFHLLRQRGQRGRIVSVWSWRAAPRSVAWRGDRIAVEGDDGSREEHSWTGEGWLLREIRGNTVRDRLLTGLREAWQHEPSRLAAPSHGGTPAVGVAYKIPLLSGAPATPGELSLATASGGAPAPLRFRLGREHYRRSELPWKEAGAPEALLSLAATDAHLLVEVSVRKKDLHFAPPCERNPLDNEHPDINSDGVQLHVERSTPAGTASVCTWLLVPEPSSGAVRVTPRSPEAASVHVEAAWRRTGQGYILLVRVPREACDPARGGACRLDVLVNEISPGRERRRGQLVLSGARGEWVYLRGDRQDSSRFLTFSLPDV